MVLECSGANFPLPIIAHPLCVRGPEASHVLCPSRHHTIYVQHPTCIPLVSDLLLLICYEKKVLLIGWWLVLIWSRLKKNTVCRDKPAERAVVLVDKACTEPHGDLRSFSMHGISPVPTSTNVQSNLNPNPKSQFFLEFMWCSVGHALDVGKPNFRQDESLRMIKMLLIRQSSPLSTDV
jgi:hypothetical protein